MVVLWLMPVLGWFVYYLLVAGLVVACVSCGFVGYLDCVAVGVCADLFTWLGDGCVGC